MLEHDPRLTLIRTWLTRDLEWRIGRITIASADASFRRYFRVSRGDVDPAAWAPKADTLIVMDAPPGKEDIAPYLKVSALLEQAGAHVPHVHAADARRGFVVMEDLGDTQYLSVLKTGRGVDKLYGDALTTLANIQVRGGNGKAYPFGTSFGGAVIGAGGRLFRGEVRYATGALGSWQTNSANSSFDINGAQANACAKANTTLCAGAMANCC